MAGKDGAAVQEIAQGVYYLKRCVMALRTAEYLPPLLSLCERLIDGGIDCQVILSEELLSDRVPSPERIPEGTLYLTDDPRVYAAMAAAARRVTVENAPVLIYLHPGNREEDFGDARYALEDPEETEPEYLERVYRRCRNLPWEILVTERCWLRETVEEDVDSFWRMYRDPEITRYTERLYPAPEEERGYIREYRRLVYSFYEFGVWTVLDRQSGAVVGRAGLSVREGYDLPELGFVIGGEWQGRGLADEVCRGILEYARGSLGFDRIQVLVHEKNAVSLHLCRKLGFREQAAPLAGESPGKQPDKSRGACSPCLVEMEQNGQRARFVYMVCETDRDCSGSKAHGRPHSSV